MVASAGIHSGLWYEYTSKAWILTLSGSKATALQAAIPIFVTFVGSAAWSILQAVLYHIYFTPSSRKDVLPTLRYLSPLHRFHEQRRILLRNSSGAFGTLLDMYKIEKPSEAPASNWLPAILSIVTSGTVHWLGWIVIGVTVSFLWTFPYVTNLGIVESDNCGIIRLKSQLQQDQFNLRQSYSADAYAQQCYGPRIAPTAQCAYYPQRQLLQKYRNASCPFGLKTGGICIESNSSPYEMDTGRIDSQHDLGINAPIEDRISFRKITTCSPVSSLGLAKIVDANKTSEIGLWPPNSQLYRFYYGPSGSTPWTFEFSSSAPSGGILYALAPVEYHASAKHNYWHPVSAFYDVEHARADISLLFINGGHVVYSHKVFDPVFMTGSSFFENGMKRWVPEYYTNVLACIDQFELCHPDGSTRSNDCTQPGGAYQLQQSIINMGFSSAQNATAYRLIDLAPSLSIASAIGGRGASALLASRTLDRDLQTKALPVDQWRREVSHWSSTSLAKLQQSIMEFVTTASDPTVSKWLPPDVPGLSAQCHCQTTRQLGSSYNFSVLALCIVLALGCVILVTGRYIDTLMKYILRYLGHDNQSVQWDNDKPLQLQQQVQKSLNYNAFQKVAQSVVVRNSRSSVPASRLRASSQFLSDDGRLVKQASSRDSIKTPKITVSESPSDNFELQPYNVLSPADQHLQTPGDSVGSTSRFRATSAPPDIATSRH